MSAVGSRMSQLHTLQKIPYTPGPQVAVFVALGTLIAGQRDMPVAVGVRAFHADFPYGKSCHFGAVEQYPGDDQHPCDDCQQHRMEDLDRRGRCGGHHHTGDGGQRGRQPDQYPRRRPASLGYPGTAARAAAWR